MTRKSNNQLLQQHQQEQQLHSTLSSIAKINLYWWGASLCWIWCHLSTFLLFFERETLFLRTNNTNKDSNYNTSTTITTATSLEVLLLCMTLILILCNLCTQFEIDTKLLPMMVDTFKSDHEINLTILCKERCPQSILENWSLMSTYKNGKCMELIGSYV